MRRRKHKWMGFVSQRRGLLMLYKLVPDGDRPVGGPSSFPGDSTELVTASCIGSASASEGADMQHAIGPACDDGFTSCASSVMTGTWTLGTRLRSFGYHLIWVCRISFGALRSRLWSRRPFAYFWYCWCPRFAKLMWRNQRRKHVLHGPVLGRMSCVAWPARKAGAVRCAQVRAWPFHSVWCLSACSHGRWTLRWWFVCHLASCVWHPSRPTGRLFWMPPPVCAHSFDPLLGGGGKGGSRATNRQQAQRDDIAALSAALASLAAKVDNLQALVSSSLGSPGPKQHGSKPDNPQPNQSVSSVPSVPASGHSQSSLCGRFGALCSKFQSGRLPLMRLCAPR